MSSSDAHDQDPPESGAAISTDAMTPRGGFMARPGLKPPPRHAVVVRGGDAPISNDIPVARSSFPPPPPAESAPISASEKITQRAIPTPPPPRIASVVFEGPRHELRPEVSPPPVAFESAPPPSDAPTYASIPPASFAPPARRKSSGWAIGAAAAAGLILGLTSVMATRGATNDAEPPVAAAALAEPLPPVVTTHVETTPPRVPSASASAQPVAAQKQASPAAAAPAKPATASAKQSIF